MSDSSFLACGTRDVTSELREVGRSGIILGGGKTRTEARSSSSARAAISNSSRNSVFYVFPPDFLQDKFKFCIHFDYFYVDMLL